MTVEMKENFNIKSSTTFKIGGNLSKVYFPTNFKEFEEVFLLENDVTVLGNLSNILISDYGFDKAVILTSKMDNIEIIGNTLVADCGVKGPKLAQEVAKKSLSGLEFMIGFPGSVGGEVFMNASANSQCISDKLKSVTCYSRKDGIVKYSKNDMNFAYRYSCCEDKSLYVLQAEFELEHKNSELIQNQMNENLAFRKAHQPSLALPNCGSIFKNPIGESAGRLLESVGAKQMSVGGARVWENHANFIVNSSNATSTDVLELMYLMKNAVKQKYDIDLEPEIKFLGGNNEKENELCKMLYKVK